MTKRLTKWGVLLAVCLLPLAVLAGQDNFGNLDTLYVDLQKIDNQNWSLTISYVNDQPVAGMSVPLQLGAGKTMIVADSAVYTGGRVEHFALKAFRPDTAIQCVTLGMVADLSGTNKVLAPGSGRLVTVFVSPMEDDRVIEKLAVDSTTTNPNNSLMVVADRSLLGPVDSTLAERMKDLEIIPALVVREPK